MNKHALLLLGIGYLAGAYVATRYRRERWLDASGPSFADFRDELVRIHKDAFKEMESSELSLEARKKFEHYRSELASEIEGFKDEAAKLMSSGSKRVEEIEAELKSMYDRRRKILAKMQDAGVNSLAEARNQGVAAWNDALETLSSQYESLLAKARREARDQGIKNA